MNDITQALANAGIAVPTITERLWRALKEQPGLTSSQLGKQFRNIPQGSISSALNKLETRGVIYAKGTKGNGPRGTAKAYYCTEEAYSLPPKPTTSRKPAAPAPAAVDKSRRAGFVAGGTSTGNAPVNLDSLTIGEARALYQQLKAMFA